MKDKWGREIDYLRVSITDRCNLRCAYCMPRDGINFKEKDELLENNEIFRVIERMSNLGITKVRLTGGEPMLRDGIDKLMGDIKQLDNIKKLYITTNGLLLDGKLKKLKENGLDGINISLDTLNPEVYKDITNGGDLHKVLRVIKEAKKLGLEVKINTVLIKGINDLEIINLVKFALELDVDIRFIELMPIGEGKKFEGISNEYVKSIIKSEFEDEINYIENVQYAGPAKYIKIGNYKCKIGFISSISNCFCKDCNRIRLTSEGFLKQCLNYNTGVDIKRELRDNNLNNEQLEKILKEAIFNKPKRHSFYEECEEKEIEDTRFMNQIGG